ncbi:hypothetical protein [Sinorhizobium meliloti]|uniref:hypothetical protein n=1 Tax=Rhizobium meliloti TaxID=382 RepID=UPI0013E32453|nr:hypothetical protein [Sinorhizobium meliloti]
MGSEQTSWSLIVRSYSRHKGKSYCIGSRLEAAILLDEYWNIAIILQHLAGKDEALSCP